MESHEQTEQTKRISQLNDDREKMSASMQTEFKAYIHRLKPRLLTQCCRDPLSPDVGAFDRNWWHYKIRDFPSIILQQGAYTLFLLSELPEYEAEKDALQKLALASCHFWEKRALKFHAFEEYYPWESAYPPLAFSTLSTLKLADQLSVQLNHKAVSVAAKQLVKRFEKQAANQQIAGLTALAYIKKLFPSLITDHQLQTLKNKSLSLQNSEGWFTEYDGPDLGYLSVTLDCLWDLYDLTNDKDYLRAAKNAFVFLSDCVLFFGKSIGMHNARNTDYILPYGILRFLDTELNNKAAQTFHALYHDINNTDHFLHAIDDR
jgi:hypothetical protein